MCSNTKKKRVLVLLATGKLGSGIVDAFLATTDIAYDVFATTRDANHPTLVSKGITPVQFSYGDTHSIKRALEISTPSILVVITACQIAKSLEKEVMHGKIILDAVKEMENPPHVILTSTELADVCSDKAFHLKSKKILEEYIHNLGLPSYT